ncbi:helix-turn-helix domain-containing protein [Gemmatimonadota bacterium]
MKAEQRLRALYDALPESSAVTFSKEDLADLLQLESGATIEDRDISTIEAGTLLGRSRHTIVRWIKNGSLRAYMHKGSYRIPLAAIEEMRHEMPISENDAPDLGSWRTRS